MPCCWWSVTVHKTTVSSLEESLRFLYCGVCRKLNCWAVVFRHRFHSYYLYSFLSPILPHPIVNLWDNNLYDMSLPSFTWCGPDCKVRSFRSFHAVASLVLPLQSVHLCSAFILWFEVCACADLTSKVFLGQC